MRESEWAVNEDVCLLLTTINNMISQSNISFVSIRKRVKTFLKLMQLYKQIHYGEFMNVWGESVRERTEPNRAWVWFFIFFFFFGKWLMESYERWNEMQTRTTIISYYIDAKQFICKFLNIFVHSFFHSAAALRFVFTYFLRAWCQHTQYHRVSRVSGLI